MPVTYTHHGRLPVSCPKVAVYQRLQFLESRSGPLSVLSHTSQHCNMLIQCFLNKACFTNSNSVCSATLPNEDAVPAKPPILHKEPPFLNPLIKTPRRTQSSRVASGVALSYPPRPHPPQQTPPQTIQTANALKA